MRVEVFYARSATDQALVALDVGESATVEDVIRGSHLLERFPEIDLKQNKVGIFGKPCGLTEKLRPGDRVEIYRPLRANPQELRRLRAAKHIGR